MISRASLIAGGVVGLIMGLLFYHLVNVAVLLPGARSEGREMERTAALKKAIELTEKRGKTNAEIRDLSPADLCGRLGGRWVLEHCE